MINTEVRDTIFNFLREKGISEIDESTDRIQELGVNSLLFIQLLVKFEDKYSIKFDDGELDFTLYETIDDLCKVIEQHQNKLAKENNVPKEKCVDRIIENVKSKKITYPQKIMMETHKRLNSSQLCILTADVKCDYEFEEVENAIRLFCERNPITQSRIVEKDNEYYLVENEANTLRSMEVCKVIEESQIDEFLCQPIDVFGGNMLRFAFVNKNGEHHLLICGHHVIVDALSGYIVVNDIFTYLEQGTFPDENRQDYFSFMDDEKQYLDSKKFLMDKRFWEEQYKNKPNVISFAHQEGKVVDIEGRRKKIQIPKETMYDIECIKNNFKVSTFDIFMAAVAYYLGYMNNYCDSVNIGTTALNRSNKYMNTLGMFSNVLPINVNLNYDFSVAEFLRYVCRLKMDCFRHQKFPYQKLVNYLYEEHDITKTFRVMLSYQPDRIVKCSKDLELEWLLNNNVETDMSIHVVDRDENIYMNYDYKIHVFTEHEIDIVHQNICKIISEFNDTTDKLLKNIEIVNDEERSMQLAQFSVGRVEENNFAIQDIVERRCKEFKDRTALVYNDKHVSYQELWEQSGVVAENLIQMGIQIGDVVGIMTDRSEKFVIALLGALRSGATYLPLDLNHPVNRKEFIIKDSNMKCVIVEENATDVGDILQLDITKLLSLQKEAKAIDVSVDKNAIAYILYTSGSTGVPKGVRIRHASIINLLNGLYQYAYKNCIAPVNLGLTASFFFDASVQQVYASLFFGHTLYIIPDEVKKDGYQYLNFVQKNHIKILDMTPSHLRMLIDGNRDMTRELEVSYLLVGGEALKSSLVKEFLQTFEVNPPTIFNVYGPTECCVDATVYRVDDIDSIDGEIVPIGKPIPNTRIYLLNKERKLLPIGYEGEIYISGDGVAAGYVNLEEENAKRFLMDPFYVGAKMYRTGDIGKFDSDGNIRYIGRTDDQVKIRGYRVELGEIENTISNQEGIENIAVTLHGEDENKQIIAFAILKSGYVLENIIEDLRNKLPHYMIPERFIQIEQMPLTTSGKVDKKLLKVRYQSELMKVHTGSEAESVDNVETKLLHIWRTVLKREDIGVADDFFDFGGHSLNMTTLSTMIHKEFHCEVPWEVLYEKADVRSIANYLKETGKIEESGKEQYSSIGHADKKDYYAISSTQKRMYLVQKMDPSGLSNNCPVILELNGKVDVDKLRNAVQEVVNRHESLRTRFVMHNGEIVQKIMEQVTVPFHVSNEFRPVDSAINEVIKPFDLENGPLINVYLMNESAEHSYLFVDIHHIVTDGESFKIIMEEVSALYNGKQLEPVKFQYKDFSEWQSKRILAGEMKKQEEYWEHTFQNGIPELTIPTDFQRPALMTYAGKTINRELDEEMVKKLNMIAKEQDLTLFMLMLSLYGMVLHSISNDNEFIVGIPVATRTHFDLKDIVGYFVNMLPVKFEMQDEMVPQYFDKIRKRTLEAYENQDFLFEKLVERLEDSGEKSGNIFQACMTDTMEIDTLDLNGLKGRFIYPEYPISKFDLVMNLIHGKDTMILSFSYSTELFREETANLILDRYVTFIQKTIENYHVNMKDYFNDKMESEEETFEF